MLGQAVGSPPSPLHNSYILNFAPSAPTFTFNQSGTLPTLPAGYTDEAKERNQLSAEVDAFIYGSPMQDENTLPAENCRFHENPGVVGKAVPDDAKPPGSGSPLKADGVDTRRLFCRNLDPRIDERQLFHKFKKYGQIERVRVVRGKGGRAGTGFVSFKTVGQAEAAMRDMNGAQLGSKKIFVCIDVPKESRGKSAATKGVNESSGMSASAHAFNKATPQPHFRPVFLQQHPPPAIPKQANSSTSASNGASNSQVREASPRQNTPTRPRSFEGRSHAPSTKWKGKEKEESTLDNPQRAPDPIDKFIASITGYRGTASPRPVSPNHSPPNARAGPSKPPIRGTDGWKERNRTRPTALSIMERIDVEEANRPAMADIPPERGFQGGRGEDSLTGRANGLLTFGVNGGDANSFPHPGQGAHEAEANREDGRGGERGASGGVMLGASSHVPTEWPGGRMGQWKGGHTNAEGGKSLEMVGSQGQFPSPTHNRDKGKVGNEGEHPGLIGGSGDGLAYVGTHEKIEYGFKPNPILDVRPPVIDAAREPNFVDRNVQPETSFRGLPSLAPLVIPDPAKTLASPSHIHPTSQPVSQSTQQQHTNNQFARPSPFSEANNATARPSFQSAPERPSQDNPFANPSLAAEGGPVFPFPTQNIKLPPFPNAPKEYPRNNPCANPSPFGQGDKSTASAGSGFAFTFSFPPLSQKKTAVSELLAWHPKAQQQVEAPVPVMPPSPFSGVNLASLENVAAFNPSTQTTPCAPPPAPPVTKAYIVPASSSAGPDPPQDTEPVSPIPLRDPSQGQTAIAPSPIVGESSTHPAPKLSSFLIPLSSSSSTTLTTPKSLADAPPLRSDTPLNSGSDSKDSDKKPTQRVPSYFDAITAIEDALEKDLGKRKRRGPLAGRKFKEGVAGSLDTGKKRRRWDDDERDGKGDCKRRRMVRNLHPSLAVLARRKKARTLKKLNAGVRLDPKADLPWSLFIRVGLEPSSRSLKRQREEDGDAVDPDELPSRSTKHQRQYHLPGVADRAASLAQSRRPSLPIVEVYSSPPIPDRYNQDEWANTTSYNERARRYEPRSNEGSLAKDLGFIMYEVTKLCGAALFGMTKAW